jgi:hypothetical protein
VNDNQKLGGSAVRPRRQQLCTSTGGFASDGEGVGLERIAYVRGTVRMTLDGQLADRTATGPVAGRAVPGTAQLPAHTGTTPARHHAADPASADRPELQQLDPSISLKPLGDIRLGANKRPSATTPEPPCKKCNLTPCFCD